MPTPLLDPVTLRWLADEHIRLAARAAKMEEQHREDARILNARDDWYEAGWSALDADKNEAVSRRERAEAKRLRALATRMEARIAAGEVRDDETA